MGWAADRTYDAGMRLILALLLAVATHASAAELLGRVVKVADGDTITVLDAGRVQHVVRLAGIDAPEKGQPFGQVSRRRLVERVIAHDVAVEWHKRDRYGRLVGVVMLDGQDVNLELVAAGLAWHYRAYEGEQAPEQRQAYREAEEAARAAHTGLWREAGPVAPWEHRKALRAAAVPD